MINKRQFLIESQELNLPSDILSTFYQKLIEFMAEYYKPRTEWKKMMEIEEKYLWPVLRGLGDLTLPIYKDAEENVRNEFIITIKDEIETRLGMNQENEKDRREYLRLLSLRRIEFFEKILHITSEDRVNFRKESGWTKWIIAGGAIVAIGVIGKNIAYKSKDGKEKK